MNLGVLRNLFLSVALIGTTGSSFAAAVSVAVYGFEYPQNIGAAINTLDANGYAATAVTLTDIATGLPGYDVLYVTHAFDAVGWSAAACTGADHE